MRARKTEILARSILFWINRLVFKALSRQALLFSASSAKRDARMQLSCTKFATSSASEKNLSSTFASLTMTAECLTNLSKTLWYQV